jgi:hypothetical protein
MKIHACMQPKANKGMLRAGEPNRGLVLHAAGDARGTCGIGRQVHAASCCNPLPTVTFDGTKQGQKVAGGGAWAGPVTSWQRALLGHAVAGTRTHGMLGGFGGLS